MEREMAAHHFENDLRHSVFNESWNLNGKSVCAAGNSGQHVTKHVLTSTSRTSFQTYSLFASFNRQQTLYRDLYFLVAGASFAPSPVTHEHFLRYIHPCLKDKQLKVGGQVD